MSSSDEEARLVAGVPSPATNSQSRVRGSPPAEHRSSGSDDHLSSEGRGTPHETSEGQDQEHSARSGHPNPVHTTLELSFGVSELKGGTDVLAKSSPPGSEGGGATSAGTPSARLPASPSPAEAVSDPQGFDLIVAANKSSAVDSPHGSSTTQLPFVPFDARTGMQSHVPAEDITGFSAGGMEALQLQLQEFVQCAAEGAAALMPNDVGVIAKCVSELQSAGKRHTATAKRLASYREEQRSFQTCVRQAAAIYGQKLSSGDFSADGNFTEAALRFNVLNGEVGAFETEVAEEQAALDQLGQQYCTSRSEFLAEQARLLQMLEGAAPSKLARANAATLEQHQSQLASLTEEVAQQTQAIAKQGRATAELGRQAEVHNAKLRQDLAQVSTNLTQGFTTLGAALRDSVVEGFSELVDVLRPVQRPAAELPSSLEADVALAASSSKAYEPYDAAVAALPVQEDSAPTFDPVSQVTQLLTQARRAEVDEYSLEILEVARTHLARCVEEQAAEAASDTVAAPAPSDLAAQPGSSVSPNPPPSSSVRDQKEGSLASSSSDDLTRAQAEVKRLDAQLQALRNRSPVQALCDSVRDIEGESKVLFEAGQSGSSDSPKPSPSSNVRDRTEGSLPTTSHDDANAVAVEVPKPLPRAPTPDAGSPRVQTTEPLRVGTAPELPPATPSHRHPSLAAIIEDGDGDMRNRQGSKISPGLVALMRLKDALLKKMQAGALTEREQGMLAEAISRLEEEDFSCLENGWGDTRSRQGPKMSLELMALMGLKDTLVEKLRAGTATERDEQLLAEAISRLEHENISRLEGEAGCQTSNGEAAAACLPVANSLKESPGGRSKDSDVLPSPREPPSPPPPVPGDLTSAGGVVPPPDDPADGPVEPPANSAGEDDSSLLATRAVVGEGCHAIVSKRQCSFRAASGSLHCKKHQGAPPDETFCLVSPAGASGGDFSPNAWPDRRPAITRDSFATSAIPLYTQARVQLQGDDALQLVNCYVDGTDEGLRGSPEYAMLREGCVCFVTLASLDTRNSAKGTVQVFSQVVVLGVDPLLVPVVLHCSLGDSMIHRSESGLFAWLFVSMPEAIPLQLVASDASFTLPDGPDDDFPATLSAIVGFTAELEARSRPNQAAGRIDMWFDDEGGRTSVTVCTFVKVDLLNPPERKLAKQLRRFFANQPEKEQWIDTLAVGIRIALRFHTIAVADCAVSIPDAPYSWYLTLARKQMPLPLVLPLRPFFSPDTGQDTGGSAHHRSAAHHPVEDLNPPTTPVGRTAARSLDFGSRSAGAQGIAPSPGLQPPEELERGALTALDREGTPRTYYSTATRHPARKAFLHSHVSNLLVALWTPGSDAYKQASALSGESAIKAAYVQFISSYSGDGAPPSVNWDLVIPVDVVEASKASYARAQLVSYILYWTIRHADLEQGLNDAMCNLLGKLQGLAMAREGSAQLIVHKLITFCHEHAGSVCYVLPFLALYESTVLKCEVLELPQVKAQKALQGLSIGPDCSPLRFWRLAELTLQQQNMPYTAEQLNAMAQVVMSALNDQLNALDGQQVMVQYFTDKVFCPFVDRFRAEPASNLWELGERLLVMGTEPSGTAARDLFARPDCKVERSSAFELAWGKYCAQAVRPPGRATASRRSAAKSVCFDEVADQATAQLTQIMEDGMRRLAESQDNFTVKAGELQDSFTAAVVQAQNSARNSGGDSRGPGKGAAGAPIVGATHLKLDQKRDGSRLNIFRPTTCGEIDYGDDLPALSMQGKPLSWPNANNSFYGIAKWNAIPFKPVGVPPPCHMYPPGWDRIFYDSGRSIVDARSESYFLDRMGDLAACCGYHEAWGFMNAHRVLAPLQFCPGCMASHEAHVAASQTPQLRVPTHLRLQPQCRINGTVKGNAEALRILPAGDDRRALFDPVPDAYPPAKYVNVDRPQSGTISEAHDVSRCPLFYFKMMQEAAKKPPAERAKMHAALRLGTGPSKVTPVVLYWNEPLSTGTPTYGQDIFTQDPCTVGARVD